MMQHEQPGETLMGRCEVITSEVRVLCAAGTSFWSVITHDFLPQFLSSYFLFLGGEGKGVFGGF